MADCRMLALLCLLLPLDVNLACDDDQKYQMTRPQTMIDKIVQIQQRQLLITMSNGDNADDEMNINDDLHIDIDLVQDEATLNNNTKSTPLTVTSFVSSINGVQTSKAEV